MDRNSRDPPKAIRFWLVKGPMVLLVVAAVAFVIGLNLFAYLSKQVRSSRQPDYYIHWRGPTSG